MNTIIFSFICWEQDRTNFSYGKRRAQCTATDSSPCLSSGVRACQCPHVPENPPAQHRTRVHCHVPGRPPGPCCRHPPPAAPALASHLAQASKRQGAAGRVQSNAIYFWASAEPLCSAQCRKVITGVCFFTAATPFSK